MIVKVDDTPVHDIAVAPGALLQDVVDAARRRAADGRLVVSLSLNGVRFAPDELSDALTRAVAEGDEIQLETGEPRSLACTAFGELAIAFEEARWQHGGVADQLAGGGQEGAIRELGTYLELWKTCQQAITQCGELLAQDLTGFVYHGMPLIEYLGSAAGVLTQVRDALEARDFVSLGDLVRYELPMLSETWAGIFEELRMGFDVVAE